ncbi:MAG: hypothetical protein RIT10_1133 [Bacteroidota bacterium]|jgi:hypothetical protein
MKPKKISTFLSILFFSLNSFSQTGTSIDPFTSLSQAASVTTAGSYHFNLNGNSFSTQVDATGFVLVAIDFGNSVGEIPTSSSLSLSNRGILTPTILKSLGFFNQTRISGPTIDYISDNHIFPNRIRNNRPLCQGGSDASYSSNSGFINNGGTGTTEFISYTGTVPNSEDSIRLSQKVYHCLGNINGIHWLPNSNAQQEAFNLGGIASSQSLKLWIKASCTQPIVPGFGMNTWNVSAYSFNEYNNTTDFNSLSNSNVFKAENYYGYYSNNSVSINSDLQWIQSLSPSTASSWDGCSVAKDYFITRFQRKGFTTGFYKISLPHNDDGVKVFLNGSEIFSFNGCCANQGVIFQGGLCASSELEIRLIDYLGNGQLVLNIEQISWPVDAGINADVIGGDTYSIGTIVNSPNAALISSNTWASDPVTSISSSVPVTVTPNETTTYTLTSVANGCSYSDEITLTVIGLLPVELISFEVNCIEENSKEIKWATASERNSAYFTIEKSNDGINWNEINKVQAAGNSTSSLHYSTIDNVIDDKTVYYRLNQVDIDGKNKLFDAQSVICSNNETIIFPNPTTDGNFKLSKDVEYTIFDSVGNKINSIEKSGVYMILIEGKLYKLINL